MPLRHGLTSGKKVLATFFNDALQSPMKVSRVDFGPKSSATEPSRSDAACEKAPEGLPYEITGIRGSLNDHTDKV